VQPSFLGAQQALLTNALTSNGVLSNAIGGRLDEHFGKDRKYTQNASGEAAGDEPGRGFVVWVHPYGETFTQNAKEGISGFNASSYGLAAGADTMVRPDLLVGAAVSLSNIDINMAAPLNGNTSNILTAQGGVYATWYSGDFFVDGVAAFGYNWYNSKEQISGFGLQRTSNYGGTQVSGKVGAGYNLETGGFSIVPSVALQAVHLNLDAHTTSGGGIFDMNVSGQQVDILQAKIGSRFSYPIAQSNGWTLTPEVHAYYVRNLDVSRITMSSTFLAGGSFTSISPARDPDIANLGLGLAIAQKGPFSLVAQYDLSVGQSTRDNAFFLRAKTEF
jgi:outer membrane autotransporter protein